MLNIKTFNASGSDAEDVVQRIIESIKQDEIKLVIFFASIKYDFYEVSKLFKKNFPDTDVIGCTTAGEIVPEGFIEDSISAMSIAANDFETSVFVMKNIKTKSMIAKNDLIKAGEKVGLKSADFNTGFIMTLIDGLQASEEKVMNVLGNSFTNLPIIGGSAADSLQFKDTYLSANGEVYQDSAVIAFVKTSKKFFLYKENIYVPTNIEFNVTNAEPAKRLIIELNGKPAAEEYARALGVSVEDVPNYFFRNPLGRVILNSIFITSPEKVLDNNAMSFYSAVPRDTKVVLLKPVDAIQEAKRTVQIIKQNLPDCKGLILFNCTYRYLQFKEDNICSEVAHEISKCGPICGFNTYGEQLNKLHLNQTLTLIAFGE